MVHRVIGFFNKALNAYNKVLRTSPLITHSSSAGLLMAAGDVYSQKFVESKDEINWNRTAKFGVLGLAFMQPMIRNRYKFMNKLYGLGGMRTPIKKIAMDQAVFAPILNLGNIAVLVLLNGRKFDEVYDEVERIVEKDFKDIMITNYTVWPAVQALNTFMIPHNYKIPFITAASLGWNVYYTGKLGPHLDPRSWWSWK